MTEAEITSFLFFGLGLTFHIAFRTLRRINYDYLTTLPREDAMEHMEDVADDVLDPEKEGCKEAEAEMKL